VRQGNTYTAYWSADGTTWNQVGDPITLDLGDDVLVGLAVTSHDNTVLNASTFANVQVN
jgi:hypothetical protein